jgi:diguanylate cyclase (GGDEF)-like protein/PAS domain S-box-containing protein
MSILQREFTVNQYLNVLRIVLIYFIFSCLWILFSDAALEFFVKDIDVLNTIQTYKGLFFISVTSAILFFLIKSYISNLAQAQNDLQETEQRLEYVIQGASLGYWDWNYQTNEHLVNDTWMWFLGLESKDIKYNVSDWDERIHPDDKITVQKAIEQTIKDSKPYVIEFRMRHKDGRWVWIEGAGAVVQRDEQGNPLRLAGTHKDINERKKTAEKISFLALNDPLTSLPNRYCLKEKLESLIAEKMQQKFAFLFIDLDYFKNINDLYGHSKGDIIIQEVAKRFIKTIHKTDFIARAGGDEFVILMHNTDMIEEECQKLIDSLLEPFEIQGAKSKISASIGVSLFPQNGENFEELFKNADTAMYVAKSNGKNTYQLYSPLMTDNIIAASKLDNEMEKAIINDEFVVYFQPQVDLQNNGAFIGAEALVRWNKPDVGLVFPDHFIRKAEENRSIINIGNIVFRKSLEQLKIWNKANIFTGRLAINISAVQLEDENFVKTIESICKDMEVDPKHIELEITESYIMKNPEQSIHILRILKNLGFYISIDDFGTGYSSLNYLKQLPVHKLKIDRSFIMDLPEDKEDRAITRAIISLAKNLELEVLAEGIETKEQEMFLRENWCDSAQGYYYSKPIDSESFYKLLCSKKSV